MKGEGESEMEKTTKKVRARVRGEKKEGTLWAEKLLWFSTENYIRAFSLCEGLINSFPAKDAFFYS